MTPSTRLVTANSSNSDEGIIREYLDSQLAEMRNLIATLGLQQNQGRQANQFRRQFLGANGDNVGWDVYKNGIIQRFGNGRCHGNNNKPSVLPLPASSSGLRPKPNTLVTAPLYTLVVLADEEDEYFEAKKVNEELNVQEEIPNFLECIKWVQYLPNNEGDWEGCQSRSTCPLAVTVEGKELTAIVNWLATLWDIKCNFKQLRMEFVYKGKRMTLRGTPKPALQCMEGKMQDKEVETVPHAELLMLNVFEIPKELPPHRSHDHKIPLIEDEGVSKPSQSPFASLIVMVKKKDNIWRMCIDYRQSNKCIVKDEFPILIIEELIDELCGATVFSKLDMRSGYHQISMYEGDVAKTTFKTHEGHYEFLVMPFGLTNAPFTFQALMNEVFKKFLRKFTLVFFDDILVYNITMEEQSSFEAMKQAMMEAPVLGLPDFDEPFVVETYASGVGLGAVLQQKGHPIAYLSKTLSSKHQTLSTYEEFLAVLTALERITTSTQMKWLPKLMGFDYEVVYKKGYENGAVDALSRLENGSELLPLFVSTLQNGLSTKKHYNLVNEQLTRKDKLVVGANKELRKSLLHYFHDGVIGGHSGVKVTTHKLCSLFYWKGVSVSPYLLVLVLHGLLESIVSDKDKVFISTFWKELFKLNYHTATKTTTFEVVYGQPPPIHVPYFGGVSKVDAVDRSLMARENAIEVLKFHLFRSQNRMKQQADKGRFERTFDVGDMVLLKQ
uniref:Putative polyprotein n=1 Tax=Tanacetum cinerariifolium TaxID=118510 RepID=A0A699I9V4_TANCI|nr:putative polyprotein [Tanacetum cinerariifolium]